MTMSMVEAANEKSILVINASKLVSCSHILNISRNKRQKDEVWNREDFGIDYDLVTRAELITPLGIEFVSLEEIWKRSDDITCYVPLLP